MIHPAWGPFLFDTSAENWLARLGQEWLGEYLSRHEINISAVTVIERIRGYSRLWRLADPRRQAQIEAARTAYLEKVGTVWPIDRGVAAVAGEIMALIPDAPTSPRRSHKAAESKNERLSRWRFDCMIAATALVAGMPLVHNNAADFESIRSAIETEPGRFPQLGPLELIRVTSL